MTGGKELTGQDALLLGAFAAGLDILARLHDREPEEELIEGLKESPLAEWFSLFSREEAAAEFDAAVAELSGMLDQAALDDLAVEFADIYLTHNYRASPASSVWLTDDSTDRQEPMFLVRGWYDHYGVKVPNWRVRPDDHIVHQLQFLAHLLRNGGNVAIGDAARFLDSNLLKWLPLLATRIMERSRNRFFIASANLTASAVEDLRDLLAELTGVPRPVIVTADQDLAEIAPQPELDRPYVPGMAESW